jgi:hypothetical protein
MSGAIDPRGSDIPKTGATAQREVRPGAVLLADTSYSMASRDTMGGLRRIDHLAQILGYLLSRVRLQALIAFNWVPIEVTLGTRIVLPEPDGGTDLALALRHVKGLRPTPERVIVLCDGHPNDPGKALLAADALRPIPIDAYYCGPDGNVDALAFMQKLAAAGGEGGQSGKVKLGDHYQIGEALRLRIAGPRRG